MRPIMAGRSAVPTEWPWWMCSARIVSRVRPVASTVGLLMPDIMHHHGAYVKRLGVDFLRTPQIECFLEENSHLCDTTPVVHLSFEIEPSEHVRWDLDREPRHPWHTLCDIGAVFLGAPWFFL